MRIADASEAMAKNHVQLINDHDMYKRWYNEERDKVKKLNHQVRGLKAAITRLKNLSK